MNSAVSSIHSLASSNSSPISTGSSGSRLAARGSMSIMASSSSLRGSVPSSETSVTTSSPSSSRRASTVWPVMGMSTVSLNESDSPMASKLPSISVVNSSKDIRMAVTSPSFTSRISMVLLSVPSPSTSIPIPSPRTSAPSTMTESSSRAISNSDEFV